MITPDYYSEFKCIGSKCKNNCCCGGWEIEVDDASMERFETIEGIFGERVRNSINSDNVFIHEKGRCPMLTDTGLCEMVINGEKLCVVCDEYPRFTEYFDDYIECGISLSCEAAADIILNNERIVKLSGNSGECKEDIFKLLINSRDEVFGILQDRKLDVYKRIRLVLDYGEALQNHINNNDLLNFSYTPCDRLTNQADISPVFEILSDIDCLDDRWNDNLKEINPEFKATDIQLEQIAVYFVYRYFMKGVFDCDVISKLKFMAFGIIAINGLADACGNVFESARRYSIEVEHNEENIDMIYDEFLFNELLSTENLINMIK